MYMYLFFTPDALLKSAKSLHLARDEEAGFERRLVPHTRNTVSPVNSLRMG